MAAWTATLVDIAKRANDEGQQVFTIVYTDGALKVWRDYSRAAFSLTLLQRIAREETAALTSAPPVVDLTGVDIGPIDLTPPVVTPPPPPDAALGAFLVLYRTAQVHQRAIAVGVLTPGDTVVIDTLAALQAAFKADYLESM